MTALAAENAALHAQVAALTAELEAREAQIARQAAGGTQLAAAFAAVRGAGDAAAPHGPFFVHLSVHGEAYIVTDPERWAFTRVASVDAGQDDYGREMAYRIADALNRADAPATAVIDAAHLARQRAFSARTFGPGARTAGVLDHIRRELAEIEAEPASLEWTDVVILAMDGALRAGHDPQVILDEIVAKQARNEARRWPDWRTAAPDRAIEHIRDEEQDGGAA